MKSYIGYISLHIPFRDKRFCSMLWSSEHKRKRQSKEQSKMNNPGKLATFGTQDEDKQKSHNMCWTPLYTHKHKQRK